MGKGRENIMPANVKYRRTQYLVAKKFQLRYVGLILLLVSLTAILCSYVIYYTMMVTMGDKLANVYPQGRLMSIVSTVNLRILLSLILVAPLVVIVGIMASHKIAGPIYRIEKFLTSMAAGELSQHITLRKNDELVSLANGINTVIDSLKETIVKERESLDKAAVSLDSAKRSVDSKPINHSGLNGSIDKLSEELVKAKSILDKYKV